LEFGELSKITEEGVKFSSPYDGKKIFMTPEDSIQIQENLVLILLWLLMNALIIHATHEDAKKSMELSMRWAKRCKEAHKSNSAYLELFKGECIKI
jgi:queuine tRNA-ribosyltransferase